MDKFSKTIENSIEKFYKVEVNLQLIVNSDSQGEAGYLSDSILSSIEHIHDYKILLIDETDERVSGDSDIMEIWKNKFGDKSATINEKMEFYHHMRNQGLDSVKISNFINNI